VIIKRSEKSVCHPKITASTYNGRQFIRNITISIPLKVLKQSRGALARAEIIQSQRKAANGIR
jgi:transcriptional regulator of met regulon